MDYLLLEHRSLAQTLLDTIRGTLIVRGKQIQLQDDDVEAPWDLFQKAKDLKEVNLYAAKALLEKALRASSVDLECKLCCQQQLISIALLQEPSGSVLRMVGDFQKSCKTCQQSWQYEGALLFGHTYRVKGNNQQALEKYREAELICKSSALQDTNLVADAIIYQQMCLSAVGNYTEALAKLEALSKGSVTGVTRGTLLYALGCAYRSKGSFQKAEEALTESIQIATELNSKTDVVKCKAELGRVYRATGDFSKALEFQESFYHHALSRGDITGVATACSFMGFTLQYLKDSSGSPNLAKAVQFLAAGMQLSHELGAMESVGWCLNNIAKAYIKSKKYKEALELCEQRLKIAKEMHDKVGEGTAYGNAGLACRGLGQFHDAVRYHRSYLEIVQKPLDKAWMEHEIALDYLALKDLSSALQYALRELITSNEIRLQYTKSADKEKIANFDKNQARCFGLLQYILVQQGRFQEALVVADMGRARAITDIIYQKIEHHTDSPAAFMEIILPSGNLNATQISRLWERVEKLVCKLQASLVFYSIIDSPLPELESTTWLYTWVVNSNPPELHFTQQILLPADQTGFDLLLGKEQQYFSELKEKGGKESRDILPISAEDSQSASPDRHSPQLLSVVEKVNKKLAHLHDVLISPIEKFLSDRTSRIIFIPHRFLLTVPYPALCSAKGVLVERFATSVALNIYLLQLSVTKLKHSMTKDHLLAIGNPLMPKEDYPQLKGASEEAHTVVKVFTPEKSMILCEAQATKEAVCKYLPSCQIAHFATHAFQEEAPDQISVSRDASYSEYTMKGGVVLAKSNKECSGILTSVEVQRMHIPAELIVLSCCKTAQGRMTHDGTLGLSRAFLCAGASAVVVTLWSIDDESTVTLMRKFYQSYKVSRDAASSLQSAMKTLRAECREPGYWGAFCLVGITPGQLPPTLTC